VGRVLAAWLPLVLGPSPDRQAEPARVYLVALGHFPARLADAVAAGLREEYGVEVERLPPVPLPERAYFAPRRRYRADKLLDHLHAVLPAGAGAGARVLGLTAVDISTSKGRAADWGVFGLGEIAGRACVISSFRLGRGARDAAHLAFRVRSTAVHEIGHTLGLPHCQEPGCVMLDAEGSIANTDGGTGHLGPGCRGKLHRLSPP
jgi:archaemetzincin